jgi:hypothetical protein
MQANNRRRQAISVLKNNLMAIQGIEEIRDDLLSQMTLDWILNADPNEPGFDNPLQMKELVEGDYPGVQIDNQQAQALLDAWMTFVSEYYAVNGGKRKKTRKHKKRGKKTRKH